MKILDLSAGNRAIWFNKNNPLCDYLDIRDSVNPSFIADTREPLHWVGTGYNLCVFDPPHLNTGKNSNMSRVYGHHTTAEILDLVERTAHNAAQVCAEDAFMALKWNTHDIKLERIFKLMPKWEPLFGHLTKDGPRSQTYWVMLRRI